MLDSVTNPSVYVSDLDDPIVTVHQSIGEAKEQFYYERTVFLRCAANSNPPVRYSWRRGREFLSQGSDKGVEIYEPFFTQVRHWLSLTVCKAVMSVQGTCAHILYTTFQRFGVSTFFLFFFKIHTFIQQ